MAGPPPSPRDILAACEAATAGLLAALADMPPGALDEPSRLPGWTRLTIVCHLRYGALASRRMTEGALAGRPTAFYPSGRDRQRPATLALRPGETAPDALRSLGDESTRLGELWASVPDDGWSTVVREPADNPDLGAIDLATLALLRLTELEVHGSDLDVGLDRWSDAFVAAALPVRLARLDRQREAGPEHPLVGTTWLLRALDGDEHLVTLGRERTEVRPADGAATAGDLDLAVIEATSADLLALLLGRPPAAPVIHRGDEARARAFTDVWSGP